MNNLSNSYNDPEQLCQSPRNLMLHTFDCSPDPYFQSSELPMESLDDPLKGYSLANPPSSDISQNSLADSGYGTGPDVSSYFVLPKDLDCTEPSQPTTDSTGAQKPRLERDQGIGNSVADLQEEKYTRRYSRRSSRASNKTSDESGVEKRERNRLAASKCRKKQKLAHSELQEKARVMSEQHDCLLAHKAALESDMITLKNELLLHGTCDYEPISDYLMQTAKRFVQGREGGGNSGGSTEKKNRDEREQRAE